MYTQVESKVVVEGATDPGGQVVSQAVSMAGGNAVFVEVTAIQYSLAGTNSFVVKVEASNDLQNWTNISTTAGEEVELTGVGYATAQVESIAAAYIRLRLIATGTSGSVIAAAGVDVADL